MRHRVHHRKLNRTSEHRIALRRNLAQSLIQHGQLTTTLAKGRDIQPFVERLITLAVKTRARASANDPAGSLRARRLICRLLGDRGLIPEEHQETYDGMSDAARGKTLRMASGRRHRTGEPRGKLAFTAESVVHRLIETVAPRYEDRPGGYTRLIRLPGQRLGDAAQRAIVQLVGEEEAPTSLTKPGKSARRRRADARYAAAIRAAKDLAKGDRGPVASPSAEDSPATEDVTAAEPEAPESPTSEHEPGKE